MSDTMWMLAWVAALAFSIGYFMGFRGGWRSGAQANEKLPADASAAINHVSGVLAAHDGRLPVGMPPSTQAQVPAPVSIGDRFTYMGLQMICVSHSIRMPLGVMASGMSAEYIDVDGLVRGHYWTPEQLDAVRAELQRADSRMTRDS